MPLALPLRSGVSWARVATLPGARLLIIDDGGSGPPPQRGPPRWRWLRPSSPTRTRRPATGSLKLRPDKPHRGRGRGRRRSAGVHPPATPFHRYRDAGRDARGEFRNENSNYIAFSSVGTAARRKALQDCRIDNRATDCLLFNGFGALSCRGAGRGPRSGRGVGRDRVLLVNPVATCRSPGYHRPRTRQNPGDRRNAPAD